MNISGVLFLFESQTVFSNEIKQFNMAQISEEFQVRTI